MAHKPDIARLQEELVDAFEWCEEDRARKLVARLAEQPRQARAVLEEMLQSEDASVRRAAVFGLGELGGKASTRRLQEQMAIEEARHDYDGESVLEVITQALGGIKGTEARASLIRRLKRLLAGKPSKSDLGDVAYALWRQRHPELIPAIRSALQQISEDDAWALRALLHLLQTSPEALFAWARDASVPPALKADVLVILDHELPNDLLPLMSAFIAAANALPESAVSQDGDGSNFCDRLFTTFLAHKERVLPTLSAAARSGLHELARKGVASHDPSCALRAAVVRGLVGRPEDAPLLEAHRPREPIFAKVFDNAAQALRNLA